MSLPPDLGPDAKYDPVVGMILVIMAMACIGIIVMMFKVISGAIA